MQIIHSFVKVLIKALNYVVPKKRRKVLFASFPDFADNARALYEYMSSEEQFADWSFVWIVSSQNNLPHRRNTSFIAKPSSFWSKAYIQYLYHLLSSRYLFSTHSFFSEALPSKQVSVLLWHGTMLKRICGMNEREKEQGKKKQFRYFVSPSKYYVQYFCKSFLCTEREVLTCGYPRNDFLFEETDVLDKLGINRSSYEKIIVYMPTFRTPIGGGYTDSSESKQMCIDIESKESLEKLTQYLLENKVLLIIKWHPSDVRQSLTIKSDSIIAIKNQALESIDAQVYHLLHYADALITDYSSVFCDYLLLDRPIAFDVSDIESYSDNRGFVFDKPLDYMPGIKLHNESEFTSFCGDIAKGRDDSKRERERLKHIYNNFFDGNNCKRLLESLSLCD